MHVRQCVHFVVFVFSISEHLKCTLRFIFVAKFANDVDFEDGREYAAMVGSEKKGASVAA